MSDFEFRQRLIDSNSPEEVRYRLAIGQYSKSHAGIAQEYLDSLDREELSELSAKRDEREEETLSLARDANDLALSANLEAREANLTASKALRSNVRGERAAYIAATAAIIAAIAAISDSSIFSSSSSNNNSLTNEPVKIEQPSVRK